MSIAALPEQTVWRVGVDIGGTFTDIVATRGGSGERRTAKVPTHPGDPSACVDAAFSALGLDWNQVVELVLGTTMATNAIVEGELPPVALLTTVGYRDTLEIGRQNRRELYRLDVAPKLPVLVPRDRRIEVDERIGPDGQVVTPLSEDEIERAVAAVAGLGVSAVAVVLQHSYVNGIHEARLGERLRAVVPYVAMSHRTNPEPREFERSSVTVLNAALMPLIVDRLARLEERIGNHTRLRLFHSAGGMASLDAVKERPIALALSGPAAGVAASARAARELGLEAAISFDMGGTTTDACLVLDGLPQVSGGRSLAGRPLRQIMVAVESIGAGGGSIARTDGKAIRVGPDSAGADPGPACYGKGGTQPTVTDANLVLGYLDAERRLGGSIRLDPDRARQSVAAIAGAFGVGPEEAALGIRRIANARMARALRRVTVERGVDARRCTLLAFGGAGPMHAVALAREFEIGRVVVPRYSSAFSALGCLTAELSYTEQRTVRMRNTAWDAARLRAICDDIAERLAKPILASGIGPAVLVVRHVALVRYAGQSGTVEATFVPPCDVAQLGNDFLNRHRELFGFATDEPWELEAMRIEVSAPPVADLADTVDGAGDAVKERRLSACWFDAHGAVPTPRYSRDALGVGDRIEGPAIVEDAWSTIVLDPGSTAQADGFGHLHVEVAS